MKINSVGILGNGAMGRLIAEIAAQFLPLKSILIYDIIPENSTNNIKDAANADLIFISTPISAYQEICQSISEHNTNRESIVISISAVMEYAEKIFNEYIKLPAVLTHPLFGQASYAASNQQISGFKIAISNLSLESEVFNSFAHWLRENLALETIVIYASAHDQIMANSHFIPFLISHVLKNCNIPDNNIRTKSGDKLSEFLQYCSFSPVCLKEILEYNKYAKTALEEFNNEITKLTV